MDGLKKRHPLNRDAKWLLLIALAVALFFWKILFTGQFSFVEDWEVANQGYSWDQFAARSIQNGIPPFWDPYTFSGRSHIGEMQPGLFYPPKLFLYLWPLGNSGALSWRLYQEYYVLAHLLGAIFMYFLALEIGLRNRFAAFVSALCFSLGGVVATAWGSQMWDSSIWLPLVFLCLLRALRSPGWIRSVLYCCYGALALGMTVLAGSIHLPYMDVLVILTASAFFAFSAPSEELSPASRISRLWRAAVVVLIIGAVSIAASAVQLLPTLEYAPLASRAGGGGTAMARIPFAVLTEKWYDPPRSLFNFLFAYSPAGTAEFRPNLGVLTLFLVIIGAYRNWSHPWVKYLCGLAVAFYIYSLAPFSFLYGVAYLLIPQIDKVREAGRFIYLVQFAMALLAGFGVQSLFASEPDSDPFLRKLLRYLGWLVVIVLLALGIPSLYDKPVVNEWHYLSVLFLIGTWGILTYIMRGNRSWVAKFLVVSLILWDLNAFNWLARNRLDESRKGQDYMEQLLESRPLADFFHSQGGLFRVHIDAKYPQFINLGDMFAVQTTFGQAASMLLDYLKLLPLSPRWLRLLNVRYRMVSQQTQEPTPGQEQTERPVFSYGKWRVYENSSYCPRAWVVHRTVVDPSSQHVLAQMEAPEFDPLQMAYVGEPLESPLEERPGAPETVSFQHYQADLFEMEVDASRRGLLVLSEIYYPGWEARVNGKSAHIYKTDGLLRGILISPGKNRIEMMYRPRSIYYGAILSLIAILGTFLFGGIVWWQKRRRTAQ